VDEGGGVNVLDEREVIVLTCFVAAACLFIMSGVGVGALELRVTFVSGAGELSGSSGETDFAICIGLGYKPLIAVLIDLGYGYKSPITVAGATVIIVTNKNAEMTGTRR
jgi:hypothetical protein